MVIASTLHDAGSELRSADTIDLELVFISLILRFLFLMVFCLILPLLLFGL